MHKEVIGQTEFIFRLVESQEHIRQVYRLRYQVYCNECGFITKEEYPEEMERDKYDSYALHFVAEDPQGIIGTARLVLDNPHGFPFEERCSDNLNFDVTTVDRRQLAEISRLIISKNYRRRRDDGLYYSPDYVDIKVEEPKERLNRIRPMAFGIYREMYQECKRRGITHWFAIMEKSLWLLLRMHNFVFNPIGEEIDFYGAVRPYMCKIEEGERVLSQKSPRLWKYFLDGLEPHYHPTFS